MIQWSLKLKVGVYAALLTMVALVAGVAVMMVTLYYHQVAKLDEDLAGDARELVWDLKNFRDAPQSMHAQLNEKLIPLDMRNYYLMVESKDGELLYRSANLMGETLRIDSQRPRTLRLRGEAVRVGCWRVEPYVIRVGARMQVIQRFQENLGIGFATGLPAVGLVVFFGGLWLGRRAVAPVAALSAAAERISADHPQERLPQPRTQDEISKLTEVLNRSFDRLQSSYDIANHFAANASHQLKTPVTILRTGLDHLSQATDMTEAQEAEVSVLRQQTRRLTSLIEDLLLLAQADSGRMSLQREDVDLRSLIQAASEDLQVQVEDRGILVEEHLPEALTVQADRRLVSMVLQNLVENAAKYTDPGGRIRIIAEVRPGRVVLKISNTSSATLEEDRAWLFERFRRGSAVGGEVRGHGLGLNIARELLRAHGGDLVLAPSEPGWIDFELFLPLDAAG